MRTAVVYTHEEGDDASFSPARARELMEIVDDQIHAEEHDPEGPWTGMRSVERVLANAFTSEDVETFDEFFGQMIERLNAEIFVCQAEARGRSGDDVVARSCAEEAESIARRVERATEILDGFREGFRAARSTISAEPLPEPWVPPLSR